MQTPGIFWWRQAAAGEQQRKPSTRLLNPVKVRDSLAENETLVYRAAVTPGTEVSNVADLLGLVVAFARCCATVRHSSSAGVERKLQRLRRAAD